MDSSGFVAQNIGKATVLYAFEVSVRSNPDALALTSWDGDLSYAQLDQASDEAVKYLQAKVSLADIVPIWSARSKKVVIALIALIKLGATFTLVDPKLPEQRIASILQQTKARTVICESSIFNARVHTLPTVFQGLQWLLLDDVTQPSITEANLSTPMPAIYPETALYVMFTSGSTGEPKGCTIEHGSFYSTMMAKMKPLALTRSSRVIHLCSYSFDGSLAEIFVTLMAGACICIPEEYTRFDGLPALMDELAISHAMMTPTVARTLDPGLCSALKTLCLGGEALAPDLIAKWKDRVRLMNGYGPSECAQVCIVRSPVTGEADPTNIGFPIVGSAWVVNPDDEHLLSARGEIGELLLEGPHLGRGYIGREDKTRETFISGLRWAHPQTRRFYKTGDIVRQEADGSFVYIGRKDTQVKINGQRVEIEEVEHCIRDFLGCTNALAVEIGSRGGDQVLVTFLEDPSISQFARHKAASPLGGTQLRRSLYTALQTKLAEAVIPHFICILSTLPRQTTTKIDRRCLKELISGLPSEDLLSLKSRQIAWTEGAARINREDKIAKSLFAKLKNDICPALLDGLLPDEPLDIQLTSLNLDSIKAVTLSAHVYSLYGVRIRVADILSETMTITKLANLIRNCSFDLAKPPASLSFVDQLKIEMDSISSTSIRACTAGCKHIHSDERKCQRPVVFLTGATGYIGSQILRIILETSHSTRVIVHGRGPVLQNVICSAKNSLWWTDAYIGRLDCWRGDLSAPKLGLDQNQWSRLCGLQDQGGHIDTIIHCGASVNWLAPYRALRETNVTSTAQLLDCLDADQGPTRLIYISGGAFRPLKDPRDDMTFAQSLEESNGYSQSKFAAEMLVKRHAEATTCDGINYNIFRPGFVIGTPREGVPNIDDFLWRMVAASISLGLYPAEPLSHCLRVCDAGYFASQVVQATLPTNGSRQKLQVHDIALGLPVEDLWRLLIDEFAYDIMPCLQIEWLEALERQWIEQGASHVLWPLADIVRDPHFTFGKLDSNLQTDDQVMAALRANIRSLQTIGFIPRPAVEIEDFSMAVRDHKKLAL